VLARAPALLVSPISDCVLAGSAAGAPEERRTSAYVPTCGPVKRGDHEEPASESGATQKPWTSVDASDGLGEPRRGGGGARPPASCDTRRPSKAWALYSCPGV
jgi:hypothetical protein